MIPTRKNETIILLTAIFLLISTIVTAFGSAEEPKLLFSFVQVTDTQISKLNQLKSVTDFILNNKTQFDIRYVMLTGDIVSVWNDTETWNKRNSSFAVLNGQVWFGWLTGNHDTNNKQYIGNEYWAFNPSNWNLTSSFNQGENTAQLINVNGMNFLFVNIQFNATSDVLQWFDGLYSEYNYATVILSTHAYIDPGTGNYLCNSIPYKFLDNYPNVKLVLSGHVDYAYNQYVDNREEIVFDRQGTDTFPDESDYMRIYSVYADGNVKVLTYSNYRDSFLNDSLNSFGFKLFGPNALAQSTSTPTVTPQLLPTSTPTPISSPSSSPTSSSTPTSPPFSTPTPQPISFPFSTPTPQPISSLSATPIHSPTATEQQSTIEQLMIISAVLTVLLVGALIKVKLIHDNQSKSANRI